MHNATLGGAVAVFGLLLLLLRFLSFLSLQSLCASGAGFLACDFAECGVSEVFLVMKWMFKYIVCIEGELRR